MKFNLCKIISLLFVTVIALTVVLSAPVQADAATLDGLTYVINDGKVTITGCDTAMTGDLVIPDTIEGYPVTAIGGSAFCYCKSLTGVTFGGSIDSIGFGAFLKCSSLTGIWVSEDNTNYSSDEYGVLFDKNKSHVIQAPGALCGDYIIPDGVTDIRNHSFYECGSLISVTIPDSVTGIWDHAFYGCSSLKGIWTSEDNSNYSSDEYGVLFDKNKSHVIQAPGALCGDYIIPDSVTIIEDHAFYKCSGLTSVHIPNRVTSIGWKSFSDCSSLTSITIPDSVTTIGSSAFSNCSSLTNITIPDSVTSIEEAVFISCSSLTSVTIGDRVDSIGYSAFFDCGNLCHVAYTGTERKWKGVEISGGNDCLTGVTKFHYETAFQNVENCVETNVYCPVCEETITGIDKAIATHSYGQWIVGKEPTYTQTGEQGRTCSACGDAQTEAIPVLSNPVDQWNVVLTDQIGVNFDVEVEEGDTVTASIEGKALEVSRKDNGDGTYKISLDLAAAQMNDPVLLFVNGMPLAKTYSVRIYAQEILSGEYPDNTKALVRYMLHYGAAAQTYFDYHTENLANEGIADTLTEEVPGTTEEYVANGKIEGLAFHSASLVYRDRIAVRCYFTGDVTGCTFTANGMTLTPVAKDGMHYVEISDILPQDLDQQITLTVTDGTGNEISVTYGPMNYIVRMSQKGSDSLKILLKALYNYHLAAKNYSATA